MNPTDINKRFRDHHSDVLLRYGVFTTGHAYREAESAFDIEKVLDLQSGLQAASGLVVTFGAAAMAVSESTYRAVTQPNQTTIADFFQPIAAATPALLPAAIAGLGGYLVYLAKKTWIATRNERDFKYREYVHARAIERVAKTDNGIYAPELLAAYTMSFDEPIKHDDCPEHILKTHKPQLRILPIRPEFRELVQAEETIIRMEDKEKERTLNPEDRHPKLQNIWRRYPQKVLGNVASGASQAVKSISIDFFRVTVPEIKAANKISHDLSKTESDTYQEISKLTTWLEQKDSMKRAKAAVARLSHPEDLHREQDILHTDLKEIYAHDYHTLRVVESERLKDLRRYVEQLFETDEGFRNTKLFMGVNAAFGVAVLSGVYDQSPVMGVLFLANTIMNIPPLLSIASGQRRLHGRITEKSGEVMQSQTQIRAGLQNASFFEPVSSPKIEV